jgi:hypothetical protein
MVILPIFLLGLASPFFGLEQNQPHRLRRSCGVRLYPVRQSMSLSRQETSKTKGPGVQLVHSEAHRAEFLEPAMRRGPIQIFMRLTWSRSHSKLFRRGNRNGLLASGSRRDGKSGLLIRALGPENRARGRGLRDPGRSW